ncbi:hypothetical protein [Ammoniphilus oxalaticus]|nr:hypothetical protein [Ammoniphilus oxalaticus]
MMNYSQLYEVFPHVLAGALLIVPLILIGFIGWRVLMMIKRRSS